MGETAFEQGEQLLLYNKPQEAKIKLEEALRKDSSNEKIYLYLGIVYEQLSEYNKAIDIMRNGLLVATTIKDLLYFNIGNNYFIQSDNILAEKNYTFAIAENSALAGAYLNRANTHVNLKHYQEAIVDYKIYLRLKPAAPQRREIEKLIALLQESISEDEDLLNNVLNNLNNASLDTETISAGAEDFQDPEDVDIDIEE